LTEEEREQFAKDNETMEKERFAEQKACEYLNTRKKGSDNYISDLDAYLDQ